MRNVVFSAVSAALLVSGCVIIPDGSSGGYAPQTQTRSIAAPFSIEAVAWSIGDGPNTLTGQAVMRTQGGDIKTCAGLDAVLIPDSAYARERLAATYGPGAQGFGSVERVTFTPDPAGYADTMRRTICDAQGNFTFQNLPDGRYIVLASVTWSSVYGGRYAGLVQQGGVLMGRVDLQGGETERVILTA